MIIETNGQNCLSVLLRNEDMKNLDITINDFDSKNNNARRAIMTILEKAKEQGSTLDLHGKIVIEISPLFDGGCHILFTSVPKARLKKSSPLILEFSTCDNLLELAKCIKTEDFAPVKSDLYNKGERYRIIIYNPFEVRNYLPTLMEFSKVVKGNLAVASTKEHWTDVVINNALERMTI